jgi:hypothetical protein
MSKCPNVKSHIGVPNQGPKSGSQIRVPYQPPNWGPKSGLKIGVPNRGPKSGSQNGVPKRGPKSGSQIGVPNPKIIRVAVASLTVKSLIVGLFLSSSYLICMKSNSFAEIFCQTFWVVFAFGVFNWTRTMLLRNIKTSKSRK